ncbi:MAG: bifunctional oligoribonuclease/PAP phosphatase NrnA [candidate division Zixibacteria bacterium]|nr:bifunctional oligoribonuclease/PAP phosphatase NrnA [candidate division Zixibacteria bacterium]MCI0596848.1 bifunctional oligoribonuclease/PAP phosphatase NrnA [candidate division Zixibacteria bacterium]
MSAKTAQAVEKVLSKAKNILVTSHQDPDGDSVGSQMALIAYLQKKKKRILALNQGKMPNKYRFLDPKGVIQEAAEPLPNFAPDAAFVVECPSLRRIGCVQKLLRPETVIVNIDHHPRNEKFGRVNWLDARASAVGEMIYDFLTAARFKITPSVAESLYTAILTDTGRFRYSSTHPRTLEICARLMRQGANPQKITEEVYYRISPSDLRLVARVLEGMELFEKNRVCFLSIDNRILAETGARFEDTEGIVDYSLYLREVLVGVLFKELSPNKTKVSLRSQNGIDISPIAKSFGGGGHPNASGCALPLALAEAKRTVLQKVSFLLQNGRLAGR